jgi:PAS domain S-box-containing protein
LTDRPTVENRHTTAPGPPTGSVRKRGAQRTGQAVPPENEASARAFLAAIVDSSEDAIIGKNLDGRILSWNPGAERLFGHSAQEAVGRSITLIIPPERRGEEKQILARIGRGERIGHYETVRLARDGRRVRVSLSISPIRDDAGRIVGASKVARDVGERTRMQAEVERQRRLLEAVVEASPLAISVLDLDGTVHLWNSAAAELFGWSAEEVVGRIPPAVHPEKRDEFMEHLRRTFAGQPLRAVETVRTHRDGRPLEVALWSSVLRGPSGEAERLVSVCADIGERKRSERAMQESRERLQAALAASRMGTFRWELATGRVEWDESLARLLALPAEPSHGTLEDFMALVHPDDRERVRRAGRRSIEEGSDLDLDLRVVLTDGSVRWLYDKGRTLRGADGAPEVVTGVLVDVTERKRTEEWLRESEERFRTLADNIAQFAWMADGSGWIFWYNQRWFDYTGTTLEEMEGWGWCKVHHPDHEERVVEKLRRAFETGQAWEDTFPLRAHDGSYRWFLSRAIPIRDADGRVHRWFGTNTDITERMQMEEALRKADRRKDEFLATLGHELRNPLAPIANGLELLQLADDEPDLRRRIHDTLRRQTGHLTRLVDDLLDLSRITRGTVELRRTELELEDVVQSAVEASRSLLDERGHRLEVELPAEPVALYADPTRIAQVLSNLLNNAARYTPRGGRIRLAARTRGTAVEIRVEDTGVGLDADMLERVFDMFVRGGRSQSEEERGLGVGLTLARSLVALHGGTVHASSEGPGEGSAFTVRLPAPSDRADRAAETSSAPSRRRAGRGGSVRVLVVDDNKDAADSLMLLIRVLGHEAHVVYDGEAALVAAAELRPDLVLLDLGMPGLDGYETAQRLRRQPWGRTLCLAALTGWGQESDRARTHEAGFDRHLVKPTGRAELEALLDEVGHGSSGAEA